MDGTQFLWLHIVISRQQQPTPSVRGVLVNLFGRPICLVSETGQFFFCRQLKFRPTQIENLKVVLGIEGRAF